MLIDSSPLKRMTPIAPAPWGVDKATMVDADSVEGGNEFKVCVLNQQEKM